MQHAACRLWALSGATAAVSRDHGNVLGYVRGDGCIRANGRTGCRRCTVHGHVRPRSVTVVVTVVVSTATLLSTSMNTTTVGLGRPRS